MGTNTELNSKKKKKLPMLFNIDLFCIIIAIIIFMLQIYITYIFTVGHIGSFNFNLILFRLASTGVVSKYVNNASTVVEVSDEDLNDLLQVVYRQIGDSNVISVSLLKSLGLYTQTVVTYLEALGYIIQ